MKMIEGFVSIKVEGPDGVRRDKGQNLVHDLGKLYFANRIFGTASHDPWDTNIEIRAGNSTAAITSADIDLDSEIVDPNWTVTAGPTTSITTSLVPLLVVETTFTNTVAARDVAELGIFILSGSLPSNVMIARFLPSFKEVAATSTYTVEWSLKIG